MIFVKIYYLTSTIFSHNSFPYNLHPFIDKKLKIILFGMNYIVYCLTFTLKKYVTGNIKIDNQIKHNNFKLFLT